MWKYFKALWLAVTGRFSAAAAALSENKFVMTATYDAAIKKSDDRLKTVTGAVANLLTIEQDRLAQIKDLTVRSNTLTKVKTGAHAAMQKRLDALKAEGKSKEQIVSDAEFVRHKSNYDDANSRLTSVEAEIDEKEEDLKRRQKDIATYKAELQRMQRDTEKLKDEKHEALADVAIAKQAEEINSVLAGISSDTTDNDLKNAREARKHAVSRSKVVSELAGNDARKSEDEYLSLANETQSSKELDGLLNWGEETKTDLDPAKLPE